MKKIIALGIAAAGAFWVLSKKKDGKPVDHWAAASDKV